MTLVAIDPDTKACGVAIFELGGKLRYAAAHAINCLPDVLLEWRDLLGALASTVIEKPQTYGGRAGKGDANDLIDLAVIIGRAQQVASDFGSVVDLVRPSEWKGTIDKQVCCRRAWETLTDAERDRVQLKPAIKAKLAGAGKLPDSATDVLDAVGLGLWKLGRMNRKLLSRP